MNNRHNAIALSYVLSCQLVPDSPQRLQKVYRAHVNAKRARTRRRRAYWIRTAGRLVDKYRQSLWRRVRETSFVDVRQVLTENSMKHPVDRQLFPTIERKVAE